MRSPSLLLFLLIGVLPGCNENNGQNITGQKFATPSIENSDSIIYHFGNGTVSPRYQTWGEISITKRNIQFHLRTFKKSVTTVFQSSKEKFEQVKRSFIDLKIKKEVSMLTGGGTSTIKFYRMNEILLAGSEGIDQIEGADVRLNYLIPEFRNIMDSIGGVHDRLTELENKKDAAAK